MIANHCLFSLDFWTESDYAKWEVLLRGKLHLGTSGREWKFSVPALEPTWCCEILFSGSVRAAPGTDYISQISSCSSPSLPHRQFSRSRSRWAHVSFPVPVGTVPFWSLDFFLWSEPLFGSDYRNKMIISKSRRYRKETLLQVCLFSPLSLPWQRSLCISHKNVVWGENHPIRWRGDIADATGDDCLK